MGCVRIRRKMACEYVENFITDELKEFEIIFKRWRESVLALPFIYYSVQFEAIPIYARFNLLKISNALNLIK